MSEKDTKTVDLGTEVKNKIEGLWAQYGRFCAQREANVGSAEQARRRAAETFQKIIELEKQNGGPREQKSA